MSAYSKIPRRSKMFRNGSIITGSKKALTGSMKKVTALSFQAPGTASMTISAIPASIRTNDLKSDAVQNAIRIVNNDTAGSSRFDMHERLNDFEKLIIEAKQSISDCVDGEEELLEEDREAAKDAVLEAIGVFGDISYDFSKNCTDESISGEKSSKIIQSFATQLDELKKELDSVLGETKRGNFLLGLDNIMKRIMIWRS